MVLKSGGHKTNNLIILIVLGILWLVFALPFFWFIKEVLFFNNPDTGKLDGGEDTVGFGWGGMFMGILVIDLVLLVSVSVIIIQVISKIKTSR